MKVRQVTTATQIDRPTTFEAYTEAIASTDTHWTSTLSTIGMTRIKNSVVCRVEFK